jgi:hypothetical protein
MTRLFLLFVSLLSEGPAFADATQLGDTNGFNIVQGTNIEGGIIHMIEYVLGFVGILALLLVVIAGVRMVVSQGDDAAKDKAKKSIIMVIVGIAIIILAGTIISLVNFLLF